MAAEAFRRARSYLVHSRDQALLSLVCGALASVLLVGWLVPLGLGADLLFTRGRVSVAGSDANFAYYLSNTRESSDRFEDSNAGLLPFVIRSRDRWFGSALAALYRSHPWTHRNGSYGVGLFVIGLLIGLVHVPLAFVHKLCAARAASRAAAALRNDVLGRKLDVGVTAVDVNADPDFAALLDEQVTRIEEGLRAWLETVVCDPVIVVLFILIAFALEPFVAGTFFGLSVAGWLLVSAVSERIGSADYRDETTLDGPRNLVNLVERLRVFKAYAAEGFFQSRYRELLETQHQDSLDKLRRQAYVAASWLAVAVSVVLIVLAVGAYRVLLGESSPPTLVVSMVVLAGTIVPASRMLRCWEICQRADEACRAVFAFLDQPATIREREGARFLSSLSGKIELEHVEYTDPFGRTLLDGLSLSIPAGLRVALLGETYLEKRAFAFLLVRFIDPTTGRIYFDEHDVRDVTLESLRSQICVVLQSDLLFPDTIINNIGCGDESFSVQRIVEAAKIAHAHHFIQKLPRGYDCVVGEGGYPLKVGESFRIALARAIVRDPSVVVIEEPTVPLDRDTRAAYKDTISRFRLGRTLIVLPRRRSTLRACDQIFVLEKGKLACQGKHRDLLKTSDLYRHLHYTQFQRPSFSA